jgi:hypothetical protein
MSDTNTNTDTNDAIQKKKNQSAEKTDVGGFIQNFAISMVGIILFIVFGTSWLYIAKLSTAKIIPHDTTFEPYTCIKNVGFGLNGSDPITVPMNTISELDFKGLKFWGEPIGKWEQEATFASQGFIKSFNNSFISNLRKKIDNPASASNFDTFKSILVNNVAGTGFWLYDKMSMPDGVRMLPDSLKIVVYGLFGLIFFPFFWIWNSMASLYYTIRTLFSSEKDNLNEGGYNGGLFDGVDALKNGDSIFGNAGKMLLRGLLWIPIWLIIIPLLSMLVFPAIGTFYPFFKMLFSSGYKLKEYDPFKDDKKSDSKSCLDFIKDNLIYKRTLILVFAILNLFTCANTYLGAKYFGGVVLATILAVIFGNIFVNTEPDDATMISVKNTLEEPVLEKPAAVDDDDCGPFQDQVINAWKKLKAQNDEADRLIQKFGNSGNYEIQKLIAGLKTQKANIIEQFKKLDGKTDLNTVTVLNTRGEDVLYKNLADAYKNFVTICSKDITDAEAKEQKKKEEQAAKEEQVAKEQASREQKTNTGNNNNNISAAGTGSSSNPPVVSTDNNNISATGTGSSSNSPVVSTDNNNISATGGGSSSNSPDVSTDNNNIPATGGGSSSNPPVVSTDNNNNSATGGVRKSNSGSFRTTSPVEPSGKISSDIGGYYTENRPSDKGDVNISNSNLTKYIDDRKESVINSKPNDIELTTFNSPQAVSSSQPENLTSAGGNSNSNSSSDTSISQNNQDVNNFDELEKSFKNALNKNDLDKANKIFKNFNEDDVSKILLKYRNDRRTLENLENKDDIIAQTTNDLEKILPMAVKKFPELAQIEDKNGNTIDLDTQEIIKEKFKTAEQSGAEAAQMLNDLADAELKKDALANSVFKKTLTKRIIANDPIVKSSQQQQQQADKKTNMLGGSKGKNKTLKNRKQRFNIRLV